MNRIQHASKPLKPAEPPAFHTAFDLNSTLFGDVTQDTSRALFAPLHYERKYAYPLIVWFHGNGNDERQLMRIMSKADNVRDQLGEIPRG